MTQFTGGPADSPGFLLWHATMRWQRSITFVLAPFDLTHVQFVLLANAWWMNESGDSPNQVRLAMQAGTDVKMASEVIGRLEGKGFLLRANDPTDARAKVIEVTKLGISTARRAIAAVETTDQAFFASVEPKQLTKILTKLASDREP